MRLFLTLVATTIFRLVHCRQENPRAAPMARAQGAAKLR